ncbi:MAG: cation:proton antiporter [Oscillospiraceae bacterium]|nr:cation:proton antiporter [Oscillospiraceae bacterium]
MPKLISDLALMLLTAGVVAVIFKRLRQPLVLGYILAGFLVGPYMPYFFTVADSASIETWSEIGIIVLMFGLGLEFNLHKLVSVGGTAIVTALTEVVGMFAVGYFVGQAMGWAVMDSVFLGGMLSMSSTTIIIKAFDELGVQKEKFAQLVFGTLVIEDIAGIFMMIILSTVSVSKSISGGALALQLGELVLYLALWLILGIYILPTLLRKASAFMNDETLLLVSLGICFGMVLLAEALGFSSALGAFLAGSLLAGTVHAERVEHLTGGIKDLFGSVFFLSVGMMIDPAMLVKYALPILIITVVTVVGKLLISSLGVLLSGQPLKIAVHCGCSLAQIGEFAFIIASLGMSLGVIDAYVYPIIVAVSVVTTLTTPTFIRGADKIYEGVRRLLPAKLAGKLERYTEDEESAGREQDGDWALFLRRYVRRTAIFGVLMTGAQLIGRLALYPALLKTPLDQRAAQLLSLAFCLAGIALFVRPMLDLHSAEYTTLWVKKRSFRLPLITLTALRLLLITLLAFFSLQFFLGIGGVWLLPLIAVVMALINRSGWMSSAYISAEARFMANFNERNLQRGEETGAEWLDEKLYVEELACAGEMAGKSLRKLNWGHDFGVNVIRVRRGKRDFNMPAASLELRAGDTLTLLGRAEDLRSLRLSLNDGSAPQLPTLRAYIEAQPDAETGVFATAIPVKKGSALAGHSIRDSGLRENYDCMILGLQRSRLPILRPDVNMTLQTDDLVWVLGTRRMAEKLLAGDIGD